MANPTINASITDEDLKAAGLTGEDGPPSFVCPECGETFPRPGQLGLHRFHKHGVRAAAPDRHRSHRRTRARTRPATTNKITSLDAVVKETVDEAVGNMIVIGGYVAIILPHTGLAISGDPGGEGRLPVQSRAVIAGDILAEYAKRDARVLEAVQRFNLFFKGSAAAKLAVDMAAVVAVDVGVVDPHMEFEIGPFQQGTVFGPLKPVEMVVGDVVAAVDNLREKYAPPSQAVAEPETIGAVNGSAPSSSRRSRKKPDVVVVEGGVEST